MDELGRAAFAYYPLTLGALLLVLLAPLCGRSMRVAFATVLLIGVVAMAVIAAVQGAAVAHLDVVNVFLHGADPKPLVYVTDRVDAPGWQWPLVAGSALLVPGLLLWRGRGRGPRTPCPLVAGTALGLWVLAVRLLLEKTAAPVGLVWSLGLSPAVVVMSPFLGGYAGARGMSFGKLALALLGVAVVQRGVLVVFGYLATMYGWGTHLDVGVLEDIHPPGMGVWRFAAGDLFGKWLWSLAVLQLTVWVVATVVVGLALGAAPWALAPLHP